METPKYPQVPRVDKLSATEFLNEYGFQGRPVLIAGAMRDWQAMADWTPEFFARHYGSVEVTVQRCRSASDTCRMRLHDYLEYMKTTQDGDPYYLSAWRFENDAPELLQHYTIPEYFYSWHTRLPKPIRPTWRWLFIGGANTGTKMHLDVMMTSAWNGVISGRKRWLFYSPDQREQVYDGNVDAFNPDLEQYPLYADARPLACEQEPGDIVFTPTGWYHQVINEQPCISITENFLNETNSRAVMECIVHSSELIKQRFNLPEDLDVAQLVLQHIPEMSNAME
jgi:histone arginine demethylase JMJD6